MALSYSASPLQTFTSMDQLKQILRDGVEPSLIVVAQTGCKACEKQIAELRKFLFYKQNTPVYKVQARDFNSALPDDYKVQQVPVIYKGHSSYGLRFGKCGIMPLEELQSFMGNQ